MIRLGGGVTFTVMRKRIAKLIFCRILRRHVRAEKRLSRIAEPKQLRTRLVAHGVRTDLVTNVRVTAGVFVYGSRCMTLLEEPTGATRTMERPRR